MTDSIFHTLLQTIVLLSLLIHSISTQGRVYQLTEQSNRFGIQGFEKLFLFGSQQEER